MYGCLWAPVPFLCSPEAFEDRSKRNVCAAMRPRGPWTSCGSRPAGGGMLGAVAAASIAKFCSHALCHNSRYTQSSHVAACPAACRLSLLAVVTVSLQVRLLPPPASPWLCRRNAAALLLGGLLSLARPLIHLLKECLPARHAALPAAAAEGIWVIALWQSPIQTGWVPLQA